MLGMQSISYSGSLKSFLSIWRWKRFPCVLKRANNKVADRAHVLSELRGPNVYQKMGYIEQADCCIIRIERRWVTIWGPRGQFLKPGVANNETNKEMLRFKLNNFEFHGWHSLTLSRHHRCSITICPKRFACWFENLLGVGKNRSDKHHSGIYHINEMSNALRFAVINSGSHTYP